MNEQEEFEFRLRLERERDAAPKARSLSQEVGRQVGLFGRYAMQAPAQVADIFAAPVREFIVNPAARALGLPTARPLAQEATRAADAAGLPVPEGALERVVGDATTMGLSAATPAALAGKAAAGTQGATRAVLERFSAGPVGQAAAGALSGGAAGATREAGGGQVAQLGAALAAPLAGGAAMAAAPIAREFLGATTGVGGRALAEGYKAGQRGGQAAEQFTANMRGNVPVENVLTAAKQNLQQMRADRSAAYRSGMVDVSKDRTVLDLGGIRKAVSDAADSLSFEGVAKDPRAAKYVSEAGKEVQRWAIKPPDRFHTPEGLDALKQRIGSLLESIPLEQRNARRAVQGIYDSVKGEINKQAPAYAKVMDDYSAATATLMEAEKALSLGQRATADTALRKLQSLMRNNVNTSYAQREELARRMIEQGGNDIMPALAGQAVSQWAPRGIQRATASGAAGSMALLGQLGPAAGMAAMSSPRLTGESALLAGRLSNPLGAFIAPTYRSLPMVGPLQLQDLYGEQDARR